MQPKEYVGPGANSAADLEALFNVHHDMVFRTAYRVTGTVVDAEDVLQTVFLRLAGRKPAVDLSPSPAAYLYRAAVNASLDLVRCKARLSSTSLDAGGPDPAAPGPDPEKSRAARELQMKVRQAVSGLGNRAAEVVALKYFEGRDNREIARIIGASQMTVAVTLHRARGRLRKDMAKYLEVQS